MRRHKATLLVAAALATVGFGTPAIATSTVVRAVSNNGTPGPSVTLDAAPDASVSVYALEDGVPIGLTPSNVNQNGSWDSVNRKVKWGPFFDSSARTLTYDLTGDDGTYTLSGLGSFDGSNVLIGGASSVTVSSGGGGSTVVRAILTGGVGQADVSLLVTPAPSVSVYAVEDAVPAGLTASSINESGSWDSVNRKVKWGPFFDSSARTLTYQASWSAGTYSLSGVGSFDGTGVTTTGDTSIPPPVAPQADAGNDTSVAAGTAVTIDGSGSADANGDSLTYAWTEDGGNPETGLLSDAAAVSPVFTPAVAGTYSFVLVVSDGTAESFPDTVTVAVTDEVGVAQCAVLVSDSLSQNEIVTFGFAPGATLGLDTHLGEVERPPLPHAGFFDARFSVAGSQGSILDLRDPATAAAVWELRFQPGLGGYPMVLTWDPGSLPEGYWRMTDLADGSDGIDLVMSTSNTLVVADASIVAVKIWRVDACAYDVPIGWSLVSLCGQPADGDASLSTLFPAAISLFAAHGSYKQVSALTVGEGYWISMASPQQSSIAMIPETELSLDLVEGWNIIGGPAGSVNVDTLIRSNPSIISVFGFSGAYHQADCVEQTQGYWLNMASSGSVEIEPSNCGAPRPAVRDPFPGPVLWAESGQWRQEIRLGVEKQRTLALPPVPPSDALDLRVQVGGIQTWSVPESDELQEYELLVQGPAVRVGWDVPALDAERWVIVLPDGHTVRLSGSGTVDVHTPTGLVLRQVDAQPLLFRLMQNAPNPFNPSTTIRYVVQQAGPVNVRVYDITGQLVRTLVSAEQPVGAHEVVWDGRSEADLQVSSGVYLYSLQSGTHRAVRKMLLMK
jgi:hypothetical protein